MIFALTLQSWFGLPVNPLVISAYCNEHQNKFDILMNWNIRTRNAEKNTLKVSFALTNYSATCQLIGFEIINVYSHFLDGTIILTDLVNDDAFFFFRSYKFRMTWRQTAQRDLCLPNPPPAPPPHHSSWLSLHLISRQCRGAHFIQILLTPWSCRKHSFQFMGSIFTMLRLMYRSDVLYPGMKCRPASFALSTFKETAWLKTMMMHTIYRAG